MTTFTRMSGYLRPYLGRVVAGAVLLGVAGALVGVLVSTMKPLVNNVLFPAGISAGAVAGDAEPADEGPDILRRVRAWLPQEEVGAWLREQPYVLVPAIIVAIFFVRGIFLYFGNYLTIKAGASVIRDLRHLLYESVAFQSASFFQAHTTGTIQSRILNDVERLKKTYTTLLTELFRVGVAVPFLLVVAFWHDWRMSLVALVALPLLGYPTVRLGRRLRRASTVSQESMAELSSRLHEAVTGARVVQGFGMERFEIERFGQALGRMFRADLRAGRAQSLAPAVMELMGAVVGAAIFIYAGVGIAGGTLDPGDFMVVMSALSLLFTSFRKLSGLYTELQQSMAAAERVFEVLDHPREIVDRPGAIELPPFVDRIEFDGVEFAYGDEKVLDGIRLSIRCGEMVALVGASGSGKSTLANLLPRFWDPTAGAIRIDGRDIRDVTLASLRAQIGIVTQETVLFNDSVRDNIAYGRTDVADERVREAARAAHAHEFIEHMPQGYDTVLGERGTRLSMGQRQRITIARAVLKSPPILILDEATSALDTESEALVQQALEALMRGRTSLVIAHRLSTVRRADRIVVLDHGRIVEEGDHESLLRRGGAYARLHDMQFQEPAS